MRKPIEPPCCGTVVYESGDESEKLMPSCEPFLSEWCVLHGLYLASLANMRDARNDGAAPGLTRALMMARVAEEKDLTYRRSLVEKRARRRVQDSK